MRHIGQLLSYYQSDLGYIEHFHCFKNGKVDAETYGLNQKSCFQRFLNEYRVARNVKKDKVRELMLFTREWVLNPKEDSSDVDKFARELKEKGITQDGKIMTSLASKILFLNNPEIILPIDTLNKRALR